MMAQKNRNKMFQIRVKIFLENFFCPKMFEKPLVLAIFGQKFDKSGFSHLLGFIFWHFVGPISPTDEHDKIVFININQLARSSFLMYFKFVT